MITAKDMRKVAMGHNQYIELVSHVERLIKTNASSGFFNLIIDISNISVVARNKLICELEGSGFTVTNEPLTNNLLIWW